MACEECLCTQHFQNRFHQCHGISAALSCTQSRVRWVIEVTGLAELPQAAASLRQQPGVTRDPQREKGSCQLGQTRNFKSLQDLQDLDALSHWADSKTDWYTSGNPHSSGGHNRNRWTQKLAFHPWTSAAEVTEVLILVKLWRSKTPILELPKTIWDGLPTNISLKIIEILARDGLWTSLTKGHRFDSQHREAPPLTQRPSAGEKQAVTQRQQGLLTVGTVQMRPQRQHKSKLLTWLLQKHFWW